MKAEEITEENSATAEKLINWIGAFEELDVSSLPQRKTKSKKK
jgi:hypothetical protein